MVSTLIASRKEQSYIAECANLNNDIDTLNQYLDDVSEQNIQLSLKVESLNHQVSVYKEIAELKNVSTYGVFKSYLDYRLFDEQYTPYQLQQKAYTDERGFRRIDDYYMVAIGTGWGMNVGDAMLVVLADGNSFKAIMGDTKSDAHTDPETHKVTIKPNSDGSVVEFIVDKDKIKKYVDNTGTISAIDEFKGAIVGIYKLG